MKEKLKVDVLKAAIQKFNKNEITKEELESIAETTGRKVTIWDKTTERHPSYPNGNQQSRVGFTYDPKHPKGKFMDKIIKKVIWKSVEFVHKKLLQGYDSEIYIYDDARLNAIQDLVYGFIDLHGSHSKPRAELYRKLTDITLAIMKEDLRYRALGFHLYNEITRDFRKFELTEAEKDNIERWR